MLLIANNASRIKLRGCPIALEAYFFLVFITFTINNMSGTRSNR
ncbi:hypothetical protein BMETH_541_1 [methanotrophic bacterial endosymbiont of Bathymodiolus sp.]|nr:hypothetical protein BMETH_541_1 [methanotrophic bacterial endosymbiont of Bathymodiolus sp.]